MSTWRGPPRYPAYRLQAAVEQFVRTDVEPAASRIDESGECPVTLLKRAGEHGLMGVTVPQAWGGGGRDYLSYALAVEAVSRGSAMLGIGQAASLKAAQTSIATDAAQAKLAASVAAHQAADKAMQVLASAGYRRGSKVERYFRDARATEIYQGTSETQRMVIAGRVLGIRRHG